MRNEVLMCAINRPTLVSHTTNVPIYARQKLYTLVVNERSGRCFSDFRIRKGLFFVSLFGRLKNGHRFFSFSFFPVFKFKKRLRVKG